MRQMGRLLHDLCQPLTTMQCRLEMATLAGTEQDYREAVELGLAECARLAAVVGSMREIVRAAATRAEADWSDDGRLLGDRFRDNLREG
jgi:signal transduction histidine kinase